MGRTKYGDGIKSNQIITEVQKRPCLFDTNDSNYGDRSEKTKCWEEVCESVVPGWLTLSVTDKLAAGMLHDRIADVHDLLNGVCSRMMYINRSVSYVEFVAWSLFERLLAPGPFEIPSSAVRNNVLPLQSNSILDY